MSDSPIKGFSVGFGSGKKGQSGGGGSGEGASTSRGPMRIAVLSALCAGDEYSTRAKAPGEPMPIDKISFERVMAKLAPAFAIELKDPFTPDADPVKIELRFAELKSMRADGIVEQVPLLRALVEARKIVTQIRDRKLGAEEGRGQLGRILPRAAWADSLAGEVAAIRPTLPTGVKPTSTKPPVPPLPKPKADALDDLFSKVAVKDHADDVETAPAPAVAPKEPGPSEFSALIASVARGGKTPTARPAAVVGTAIEKVDRAFGRLLGEIVRHPEVRRLERAWRGLKLLVDGCDTRAGVEVDVIPVDKAHTEGAIAALVERHGAESARAPIDLFVADHDVDSSEGDTGLLTAWARAAADLHAPIVVNGHASLLGITHITELPKASRRLAGFDDPRPADARAAAANDATRWATVAMNGPLVRGAYTPASSRLREIPFAEAANDHNNYVFAGASIAVGILCAQSYVRTGWPTAIVGPRDGVVGNLPVYEIEEGGQTYAIPLETMVGDDVLKEAARAGIALFGCAANHDAAVLSRAPVYHKRGAEPPTTTLGDQLFVGRFASAVQQVAAALPGDVDPAAGAEAAQIALLDLFTNAPPSGPEVRTKISGGRLEVHVRPRRWAGVALEEFALAAPLG